MDDDLAIAEIMASKLFWVNGKNPPKNKPNSSYFSIDNDLVYEPFNQDFGPLNISMVHKYCCEVKKLVDSLPEGHSVYHYTNENPINRTNSAFLPEEAWVSVQGCGKFLNYRDAGFSLCTYKCTVLHCLEGLYKAMSLNWYSFDSFSTSSYEELQRVENGDLNWIIPGKFIAFSAPSSSSLDSSGFKSFTPEDYSLLFNKIGVTTVIRLNKKTYESQRFKALGIKHHELYFLDGSCPSDEIVLRFLSICEQENGAIAVHCKAGLGRTGTLIGCYAMKHFDFSASSFIGWIRLCRPGSVLGPQQQFLLEMENKCKAWGKSFDKKKLAELDDKTTDPRNEFSPSRSMSPDDSYRARYGEKGQADRLIKAKQKYQSLTPGRRMVIPLPAMPKRVTRPKAVSNIFMNPQREFRVPSTFGKKLII